MSTGHREQRLAEHQRRFHDARQSGDRAAEIDALLGMALEQERSEDFSAAHMHAKLAEKVICDTRLRLERLHEALGQRALVHRVQGQHDESLRLLEEAVAAARQHGTPVDVARWTVDQAGLHRKMKSADKAREAIGRAREALRDKSTQLAEILGRSDLLRVLAQLEGETALLDLDAGDEEGAEDGYRRAFDYAQGAHDDDAIATWGANVGRACRRRRRYTEGLSAFATAADAALRSENDYLYFSAARGRVVTLVTAHRHVEAGECARESAKLTIAVQRKAELLDMACSAFEQAAAFDRAAASATALAEVLKAAGAVPGQIAEQVQRASHAQSQMARLAHRNKTGPKPLDVVLVEMMSRAEKTDDADTMCDMAHLVCDVKVGLGAVTEEQWSAVLAEPWLRHRVVADAVAALCRATRGREALELLQRYKAPGFAELALRRLKAGPPPGPEASGYLEALRTLAETVEVLKAPAQPECFADTERVRAAGEALLEAGELLRERDMVMLARLGGVLQPDDLLEALPRESPVAIVDFIVGPSGTSGVVLTRSGGKVQATPMLGGLTAADTHAMLKLWSEARIASGFGQAQAEAITEIGAILHRQMFCQLMRQLAEAGITQLTLIPDLLTRHLPLHAAHVCGEEIAVAGVDTAGAVYLAELMPVDYAPCLQAVAVSQFYRRPRKLSTVVSLADAAFDLPGARYTSQWLQGRLPGTLDYQRIEGAAATVAAFSHALEGADVVVVGTHGHFDTAAPERTSLELSDGSWTASMLADRDLLGRSPVLVLSACEAGVVAPTPDDRIAAGIPGALVAAGAASVLASLWPVEDISMGYLIERFLTHLSYPGWRPSAALFRAIRDLVRLPQADALARCNDFLRRLEADGKAEEDPEGYILIDNLRHWIKAHGGERPFAHPMFWGGVVITGGGWSAPAGASVGGAAGLTQTMDVVMTVAGLGDLLRRGRGREAREQIMKVLPLADGIQRAQLLLGLACAVWEERGSWTAPSARRRALGLLGRAERLADAEEDDEEVARVREMRAWIERETEA